MTSAASSSNSGSTGGPNRVSTYFVLTFYRNNRVIVTTNAIGAVKSNTQMAVERIMGFTRVGTFETHLFLGDQKLTT